MTAAPSTPLRVSLPQGSTLKGFTLDHYKEKKLESDGKFYLERIDTPFFIEIFATRV